MGLLTGSVETSVLGFEVGLEAQRWARQWIRCEMSRFNTVNRVQIRVEQTKLRHISKIYLCMSLRLLFELIYDFKQVAKKRKKKDRFKSLVWFGRVCDSLERKVQMDGSPRKKKGKNDDAMADEMPDALNML